MRDALRARSWTVQGFAKVTGAIDLDRLQSTADLAVAGPANVDAGQSVGHLTIEGPTTGTGAWSVAGEHRFGGPVKVGSLRARGRVDVKGDLTVEGELDFEGTLDVRGAVRAGSVRGRGAFAIQGEIRSARVDLTLDGTSSASGIRADSIRIARRRGGWTRAAPEVELLEVEGKDIDLTGVVAQDVRGERIRLGPGCRVSRTDGTVVARDRSAIVGPHQRTKLPKGLSR